MGRSELLMFLPGLRDRVRQHHGLASVLKASTKAESIRGDTIFLNKGTVPRGKLGGSYNPQVVACSGRDSSVRWRLLIRSQPLLRGG